MKRYKTNPGSCYYQKSTSKDVIIQTIRQPTITITHICPFSCHKFSNHIYEQEISSKKKEAQKNYTYSKEEIIIISDSFIASRPGKNAP